MSLKDLPTLPLDTPGCALDFSLTEFAIPVVSARFVSLCQELGVQDDVQFIPARVACHMEPYFILNALRVIRCIDETRSEEVTFWEPRHGEPGRVGHYRSVAGMKIDVSKVEDAHIFRPWGWTNSLLVSEHVKVALEREKLTGPRFTEV